MKLYNLGKVSWQDSQLIYHALAELGWESLVLLSPETPYVCIGYHQDVNLDVDLDYCKANNIPVFRREVGGGAVYLDGDQLFFQLILPQGSPIAPPSIQAFYRKFLQPIINVYREIGIEVQYKPVNDLVVENRKICGSGAGEIGESIAFVGNMIIDFDYRMMSRVLRIPDEKFRDKVKKTIEENLSTIRRELGADQSARWDESTLNRMMADEFSRIIGPLEPSTISPELELKVREVAAKMLNDSWLHKIRRNTDGQTVKVRSGLEMIHRLNKTVGGLIRAEFAVHEGRYKDVSLSGDFFSFPKAVVDLLAAELEGRETKELPILIKNFFSDNTLDQPGISPDDWLGILKI